MEYSVITPQEVLESLMNDGTIDAIRLKIIKKLKANEELKNNTLTMVEESKVLNTPGAEKQTKREMLDALRQELETPVLEKASKSIWELILDNDGLGKEIFETVERVFCRLSGREPPLFPPNNETIPENEEDREDLEIAKEKEKLVSSKKKKKKRDFSEMSVQEASELADGCDGSPAIREDPVPQRRKAPIERANIMESEPWRCKRTDGKSWRCSNDTAPGLKYCEKHLSRGRSISRKHIETTSKATRSKATKSKATKSKATKSSISVKESKTDISVSIPTELMTNNTTSKDDNNVSLESDLSPTRKSNTGKTEESI